MPLVCTFKEICNPLYSINDFFFLVFSIEDWKVKIALYQSQREIHTVAARAAPEDLGLKSHPEDCQQLEIDILIRSPI